MTTPFRRTTIASAVSGLALALAAGQAFGSAFALAEQNVMGLGNAFAGAAATAEDANTVWHNPAGLARLNFPQVETAIHVIIPSAKFQNANSQAAALQPLGGTGGDAGGAAFVPNLYGSMAINDRIHVGIGVNVPFGLKTEYDDGWLGRYQALKSEVKTINVNPAMSWKVTDQFWLGAGANYQHFEATLTNNTNYSAALAQGYRSARRGRPDHSGAGGGIECGDGGSGYLHQGHRRRLGVGMERRRDVQLQRRCQQRPRGGTNRPRLSVEAQVQRRRQRQLHQSDDPDR